MKESARYIKTVAWSEEDQCYIGRAPGLLDGGCHGEDEAAVFEELCQVVEEVIQLYREDGKELPPPTCNLALAAGTQDIAAILCEHEARLKETWNEHFSTG